MTFAVEHPLSRTAQAARLRDRVARLARQLGHAMARRRRRAVAQRDLRALDSHMLRDMGLSHRAAAERWRGHLAERTEGDAAGPVMSPHSTRD